MKCQMMNCLQDATRWMRGRDVREAAICSNCESKLSRNLRKGARVEFRMLTPRVALLLGELNKIKSS